jgi:hypothetical protein
MVYDTSGFSILSPTYAVTYNSGSKLISGAKTLIPNGATDDSLYMAGSINNKISLFKFGMNDGSSKWVYSIRDTASVSTTVVMSMVDTSMSLLSATHLGCAENIGSDTYDFAFL